MPAIDADRPEVRGLTTGERALAESVFGRDIALDPVTIRRQKYWMFHPWWVTMAPDGHIWCHPNGFNWSADFAAEPPGMRAHFIHEMVHVWQCQHGRNLLIARPPLARYRYDLVPGKPFARYGIEQQACIVADAYLLREGRDMPGKPALARYAGVIPFGRWL
ncbi:MAG: vgr related protein [Polymorphobacter sp.]